MDNHPLKPLPDPKVIVVPLQSCFGVGVSIEMGDQIQGLLAMSIPCAKAVAYAILGVCYKQEDHMAEEPPEHDVSESEDS